MSEETNRVIPGQALKQVAEAIPADCRQYMIIVGSLAAGYYFFGDENIVAVRTKDADCLLSPGFRPSMQAKPSPIDSLKVAGSFMERMNSLNPERNQLPTRIFP